jgi:hypothetical protein
MESCSTVPVKLLAGAALVGRLAAERIITSSIARLLAKVPPLASSRPLEPP